ncbi:hypothetical protein FEP82_05996 [Burkholderia multivorans]|nr:hypothetical protein [Burkholderia multivorans]
MSVIVVLLPSKFTVSSRPSSDDTAYGVELEYWMIVYFSFSAFSLLAMSVDTVESSTCGFCVVMP